MPNYRFTFETGEMPDGAEDARVLAHDMLETLRSVYGNVVLVSMEVGQWTRMELSKRRDG